MADQSQVSRGNDYSVGSHHRRSKFINEGGDRRFESIVGSRETEPARRS